MKKNIKTEEKKMMKITIDERDFEALDQLLIQAFQATWNADEQLVGKLGDVLIDCGAYTEEANNFMLEYFHSYGIELVY